MKSFLLGCLAAVLAPSRATYSDAQA